MLNKIINIGSAMQMFFEVGLFTGAIWLSGLLGTTQLIRLLLSLASLTFMFMGLSVAVTIRVGIRKDLWIM
jgi:MATE family multidrug resistance protein